MQSESRRFRLPVLPALLYTVAGDDDEAGEVGEAAALPLLRAYRAPKVRWSWDQMGREIG